MPKQCIPSVSSNVHYVNEEDTSDCQAAVVVGVLSYRIGSDGSDVAASLAVFNRDGLSVVDSQYSEDEHRAGTWHWPEHT